jgi:hypothetical protein
MVCCVGAVEDIGEPAEGGKKGVRGVEEEGWQPG